MTDLVPHNIAAEEALLGAVLMDGSIYPLVLVESSDFYIHRHQYIWRAFRALQQRGLAIDMVTVAEELDKHGHLTEVGGASALTTLVMGYSGIGGHDSYATIVRDKATRRKQIGIANALLQNAINGGVDVAEVIDLLSESSDVERAGRHISQGLSTLYDEVAERAKDPKDVWGIPTGFIDVDKRTGGLQYHQTVMVSGDPGVGKTTLMLQMALEAAKAGYGVGIFEAEMDEQACLRRLIEIYTNGRITNRMMTTGRMPDDRWQEYIQANEHIRGLPIHINDDPEITTAKIRTECAKLRVRMPLDLICMDYVNLLKDKAGDGKDNNQNAVIKAQRFRDVCRYLSVAGLTVQSMTKEGMRAAVPQLADMSGPAEIHYGADVVFFLVKSEDAENVYKLLPAKQRYGDKGSAPISIIRRGLPFYNAETKRENVNPTPWTARKDM